MSSAVDAIFAAADAVEFDVFGELVTYRPVAGASLQLRLIVSAPDAVAQPFDTRISRETVTAEVRAADLAQPAKGDLVELFGEFYEVAGKPERRIHDRAIWVLDLKLKR